jgi:fusion and transport protein UGO1
MGELNGTADNANAVGISVMRTYARVFVSQPFEVCRLLLQVGDYSEDISSKTSVSSTPREQNGEELENEPEDSGGDDDEEDDEDEVSYFTAVTGDQSLQFHRRPKARRAPATRTKRVAKSPRQGDDKSDYPLTPTSLYIFDLMRAINERDGLKGLWRGLHTTFVLDGLTATMEAWLSGFFASVLDVPDPQFVEVLHSPAPLTALGTAVAATVTTAVLLSPIDLIRTRLMATTFSTAPRSFRTSIVQLKSWASPITVLIPTILHSGLTSLIRLSTPYVLYTRLGVDAFNQPVLNASLTLVARIFEVCVKLPLETMVRRAQLASENLSVGSQVVRPKPYRGVAPTLWDVLVGNDSVSSLYRGWRTALAGAVGEWGVESSYIKDRARERF